MPYDPMTPAPTGADARAAGRGGVVLVVAILLTALMGAPVLRDPEHRLFGSEIAGRHHVPFVVIAQFQRPSLPGPYTQPVTDYAGAVLARIVGPVTACNLLVLVSFPLAALFGYLLAGYLTRSHAAAALAGLAYAFSPFHLAHAAYHPHLSQIQWLPLYLLALWRFMDRPGIWRGAVLLGAGTLVALSAFYYALVAGVLTPVAVVAWAVVSSRACSNEASRSSGRPSLVGLRRSFVSSDGRRAWRAALLTTAVMAALCGLIASYARWAAPAVWSAPSAFAFPEIDLVRYSAVPWSYLVPPVDHPIAGSWARRFWQARDVGPGLLEQQVTLGAGLLVLAGISVLGWLRRWDRSGLDRAVPVLLAVGAAGFVCSMPPEWQVGSLRVPLPSGFLHSIAPMFRAYARFGVAVGLVTAILAGIGLAHLVRRRQPALAVTLVALVVLELAPVPPWRWRDVLPTPAHRWLANLPAPVHLLDTTVTQLGIDPAFEYLLGHKVSFPSAALADLAEPNLAGKLAAFGYTHVLSPRSSMSVWGRASPRDRRGLEPIRVIGDLEVLRISAQPSPIVLLRMGGFYEREFALGRSFRWMGDHGVWWLMNREAAPVRARLLIEMHAFRSNRSLRLTLDGREVATVEVEAGGPGWYDVGPLVLGPGQNTLVFRPLDPPEIPKSVSGTDDDRRLSIAVWEWHWHTEAEAR